ncbi:alpha/beta hydrolase [Corallococcus sp. H22C18031201]|uniref:alpha/beta fold hydrolase n=1 Tax=Citreicoccus inhibens TaxID=2849499 RepID=UPI000E74A220|nr:alpha/beta hydrolase [Citreicoccus inhibens]MBU8899898.1 alpha/beta hydrolase [Citreicoccus inhibens]RJS15653.1 alpha/beta hydrolase [Corallococcus sp. H22C18031201]
MPEVLSSGGARLRFDDVGRGEPALLFIPAWCTTRAVFQPLVPLASAHRRLLSVDLRGHGDSEQVVPDFDNGTVIEDLRVLLDASGAQQVVPVALSHAGWWALELRRRLGPERIPKIVLLDWLVTTPPARFHAALRELMTDRWTAAREGLFRLWTENVERPEVLRYVRDVMGAFGEEMWARAAREIGAAYAQETSPLRMLATLGPDVEALHLYAQPDDADYLTAQVAFGAEHPGFHVLKLPARSHFPTLEVPELVDAGIQALITARRTPLSIGVPPH